MVAGFSQWLTVILIFMIGFFIGAYFMERKVRQTTEENQSLRIELTRALDAQFAEKEKLEWTNQAMERMKETFQAVAGQTLQDNSDFFLKYAREYIDAAIHQMRNDWSYQKTEFQHLLDPIKEHLSSLGNHIRELEQKREGAYQSLTEQIRQLLQSQIQLNQTTITLSQALKSPTIRGQWGELQLRRIVELAGMVNHVSFSEQVGTDGGRPDMIVYLPNSGILPIDSKTPLESYLEAIETQDETVRKIKLSNHIKAMRNRIQELSLKKYWDQFESSPEFVVMFVPSESCLSAAFEADPELLEYAINKRVLITSPVTLIALLKSVAYGWQQHQITEKAKSIAADIQDLYKRLMLFLNHLSDIGKCITKTKDAYTKAVGSLKHRVFPIIKRFEMSQSDKEFQLTTRLENQDINTEAETNNINQ